MSQSEIRAIRALIDVECRSLEQIKHGFAQVSSHDVISQHYDRLGRLTDALASYIGQERATSELCERINKIC